MLLTRDGVHKKRERRSREGISKQKEEEDRRRRSV